MSSGPRPAALAVPQPAAPADALHGAALQRRRRLFQAGFFVLFLLAPALDLLRFDLTEAQLWFAGQRWSLGITALQQGQISATQAAVGIFVRAFLPGVAFVGAFLFVAWRYGRLYCGWLCPHFSAVELLNDLLHRACGKLSLWDREPVQHAGRSPQRRWWPLFAVSCAVMGSLWAITLLTYLLPPATIWGNLVHGSLTPNQARFIGIASVVFTLEFAFARHLFCRFGCAVGLFQSLAWMANPRALVMAFNRDRARDCRSCGTAPAPGGNRWRGAPRVQDTRGPLPGEGQAAGNALRPGSACDAVCPMRLKPRNVKRLMFSCVQCGRCGSACESSQGQHQRTPLLQWTVGADALRETLKQRRAEQADRRSDGPAARPASPPVEP